MQAYANGTTYLLPIGTRVTSDKVKGTIVGTATMHAKFNEHGWIRPACERCHGQLVAAAERAIAEGR